MGENMLGLYAAQTLAACGFQKLVAVCNPVNAQLNPALAALGYDLEINPDPAAGQAQSLALGIAAIEGSSVSAVLVALADMSFISSDHLAAMVDAFDGDTPVCSTNGRTRMPPAIFPQSIWPDLQQLSGDQGARSLLADAIAIEGDPAMLADIDRPEDLPA
jgi:molybdenum cofactor cytidylyltransferase